MKPPTHQALVHTLFLLLVVGQITQEVIAYHSGYKNHHHEIHHHQGHHEGHHHSASHHGHHGTRAPRTRREKEAPGKLTGSKDNPDAAPSEEDQFTCTENAECSGLDKSYCDSSKNLCVCPVDHPIIDAINGYCVAQAKLDTGCKFDSECDAADEFSYCGKSVGKCVCREGYNMVELPDVGYSCVRTDPNQGSGSVDPAMIGVLVGLALMFVIICVVLRLFSKARFRENRSIFNTPNPRLMNASLFKDSGVAGRRGSAMSTVSATGSAHLTGGAAPKTPSPGKETKNKSETTVAIENVD